MGSATPFPQSHRTAVEIVVFLLRFSQPGPGNVFYGALSCSKAVPRVYAGSASSCSGISSTGGSTSTSGSSDGSSSNGGGSRSRSSSSSSSCSRRSSNNSSRGWCSSSSKAAAAAAAAVLSSARIAVARLLVSHQGCPSAQKWIDRFRGRKYLKIVRRF